MKTEVWKIDPLSPDPELLLAAAEIIRAGGLVSFPTETVYGLGANALNAAACLRIFAAKGRPATNPLIVHVPNIAAAQALTSKWPNTAANLVAHYWPGPLTLVLNRSPQVPDVVTAEGPTVAIRVPAHPVARGLIAAAGLPIAAPSANRSTGISATQAEHVLHGLEGRIELVLDAGPTPGGLESTVLDVTVSPPRLLRPGLLSVREIEQVIGPIATSNATRAESAQPLRSPGLQARHYSPRTPLELAADDGWQRVRELARQGLRIGWLTFTEAPTELANVTTIILPPDPVTYAAGLYAALHTLDNSRLERIVVAQPPTGDEWLAIRDRLTRAAAHS